MIAVATEFFFSFFSLNIALSHYYLVLVTASRKTKERLQRSRETRGRSSFAMSCRNRASRPAVRVGFPRYHCLLVGAKIRCHAMVCSSKKVHRKGCRPCHCCLLADYKKKKKERFGTGRWGKKSCTLPRQKGQQLPADRYTQIHLCEHRQATHSRHRTRHNYLEKQADGRVYGIQRSQLIHGWGRYWGQEPGRTRHYAR